MFRKLLVYQKSIIFTTDIYKITANFPKSELFGITSQMRRCAVSVASNIAEGSKFSGKKYAHFIKISLGSACELRCQLEISTNLNYIKKEDFIRLENQAVEITKMLHGLLKRIV